MKNTGNIIRITDIFKNFKNKKEKKNQLALYMVEIIFLSTNNGRLIVDISREKNKKLKLIMKKYLRPFIQDKNLFI